MTGPVPDAAVDLLIEVLRNSVRLDSRATAEAAVAALHAAGWLTDPAEGARLRELLAVRTADHDAVVAERDALAEQLAPPVVEMPDLDPGRWPAPHGTATHALGDDPDPTCAEGED